jgi:hypothetical protein
LNKLKSPVYLCFLVGGGLMFVGMALNLLSSSLYGPKHCLSHVTIIIGIAGFAICSLPACIAFVVLTFDKIRNLKKYK